jgi:hypothetical protein
MSLISTSIPNLVSGVSQQADGLRYGSQAEEQVNGYSSLVEGLIKRPPLKHIAKLINGSVADTKVHTINRDSSERYVVVFQNNTVKVFDIDGTEKTVATPDGVGYITTSSPSTDLKCLTVADYTFVLNKTKTVAAGSGQTPAAVEEAMVFISQGDYSVDYKITLGGTTYSHSSSSDTISEIQPSYIATQLATAIGSGTYTVTQYGATLHIVKNDSSSFTCDVEDSKAGDFIKNCTGTVQNFVDLPVEGPDDYLIKIEGTPEEEGDEYWVKFVADDGTGGSGKWSEAPAPGIDKEYDATTMPHQLVREADGTFTFSKATWAERLVGDDDTNPVASFVTKKIKDVFFFKNRLGYVADENIIFSEASEYFNFWRTTVTQLLDSDMIDIGTSSTKVSILFSAIPFYDRLVLFANQTQFTLQAADLLTPKTVSIQQSTAYTVSNLCEPVPVGRNLYFAFDRNQYSGVQEYFINPDTQFFDGADVTAQVPKYLKGNITKITAADNEQVLVCQADGFTNGVYVYKYFFSGSDKLQSAWFKFDFGTGSTVLNTDFIDATLYVTIKRDEGVFLESIDMEAGQKDTSSEYVTLLDRREAITGGSYSSSTDKTTFTMPYNVDNDTISIVSRPHPDAGSNLNVVGNNPQGSVERKLPEGVILDVDSKSGTSVVVNGNYTNQPIFAGVAYTMTYDISRPQLRTGSASGRGQVMVAQGRFQIRNGVLVYNDSRYFRVEVTPSNRDKYSYVYNGRSIGTGTAVLGSQTDSIQDGIFRFPVYSKNDQVVISILNDSPFPSSLVSMEFEAIYAVRNRRYN